MKRGRYKLKLTPNALTVLKARYLLKDSKGDFTETPEQLFKRVSSFIAAIRTKFQVENSHNIW